MWIVTQTGFVSVVRHRTEPEALLVRARDRESLEAVCRSISIDETDIVKLDEADYRFRVLATNDELKAFLDRTVDELDYDNFKSRVWQTRGARWHDALLEVWRMLRKLQDAPTRESA